MITLKSQTSIDGANVIREYEGLSTDGKPTGAQLNGSIFNEIDTGKKYMYDAESGTWYEQPQEGGGTSDYSELENKPQINGVELDGNKSASDFGLADEASLNTKLNIEQGVSEAGKFLAVGDDGNITTIELSTWTAGGAY